MTSKDNILGWIIIFKAMDFVTSARVKIKLILDSQFTWSRRISHDVYHHTSVNHVDEERLIMEK